MDNSDVKGDRVPAGNTKEIIYVDPTTQGYIEYFDHLRAFNAKVHRELGEDMGKKFSEYGQGIAFATTGSDSRLEKGPVSPVEIVLYTQDKRDYETMLAQPLDQYLKNNRNYFHLDGLDLKFIGAEMMSYFVTNRGKENEGKLLSPNRVLDSTMLFGDQNMHNLAKRYLYQEIKSSDGKAMADKIKDKLRGHKKITLEGTQNYRGFPLEHFNFESGIANYDPEKNLQSFKQGPLRTTQYALVNGVCTMIRRGDDESLISSLPSNTIDKIHALEVEGKTGLSQQNIRELSDNYKFFLWLYHKSQHAYRTSGITQTGFDSGEAKERAKSLTSICSEQIVK
ncbi:MAG: hypothetical protein WCK29_03430 [archaeon]